MALHDAIIGAFTASATTAAVNVPANSTNDIMLVRAYCEANRTISAWPSGFTGLTSTGFITSRGIMAWAWKRISTTDSGTYTVTFSAASGGAQITASSWSGRDTSASPFSFTTQNNSTSSVTVPPTLTGTAAAGDDLSYVINEWNGTTGMTAGDNSPSFNDFTLVGEDVTDGSHHWKLENASAGSHSVATSTTASGNAFWVTLVAMKAAAGGSPTIPDLVMAPMIGF